MRPEPGYQGDDGAAGASAAVAMNEIRWLDGAGQRPDVDRAGSFRAIPLLPEVAVFLDWHVLVAYPGPLRCGARGVCGHARIG